MKVLIKFLKYLGCCLLFVVIAGAAYSLEHFFFPEHGLFGNQSSGSLHVLFLPFTICLKCFGEGAARVGLLLSILIGGSLVFLILPGFARILWRIGEGMAIYAKTISLRFRSMLSPGWVRAISLVLTLALWALTLLGSGYYLLMLFGAGFVDCPDCLSRNWWKVLLTAFVLILIGIPGALLVAKPALPKVLLLIPLAALVTLLWLFSPLAWALLF